MAFKTKTEADCDSDPDTDSDTDKVCCAGQAMHWNAGLKGRKKDSSGRSPEIRGMMDESPERAKETGNFLLFRPCQGSCYCACQTPGAARSYPFNGFSGRRIRMKTEADCDSDPDTDSDSDTHPGAVDYGYD